MASHGPTDWIRKERRRLARVSAEIVNPLKSSSSSSVASSPLPQVNRPYGKGHSDFTIPEQLLKGTTMTKVSKNKQEKIVFHLDPDEGRIIYQSSKMGIVPIELIKEIRSGNDAKYYRAQFAFPYGIENLWITVIYILEGTYKTLHMVADTYDVFQMWDTALRKLFAIRQGLMTGLGNVEMRQTVWERQYWKGADLEGDQKLEFEEIERLCMRLNANLPTEELRKLFSISDTHKQGYLDFTGFQSFVKLLKRRPDVDALYKKLCDACNGKFDFTAFANFMRTSQQSKASNKELKAIFGKYSTTISDSTSAVAGIAVSTSNSTDSTKSPKPTLVSTPAATMTIEGFSSFLLSSDNPAFSEENHRIWQDMALPISDYFISSSHNTYLVGHQLIGVSTIEGYIRALLHSCRSVELDIYDGDDGEPVIFHGKTFTSAVSLRDICQAIARYAFVTSPYPVLISAEVHCGLPQQDKMVDIMVETFGEALVRAPIEGRPKIQVLPSPEDLRQKFLLKAKNLYVVEQLESLRLQKTTTPKPPMLEADQSSESSDSDDGTGKRSGVKGEIDEIRDKWRRVRRKGKGYISRPSSSSGKPKVQMSFELASLLVYTVGVKCHGVDGSTTYAPEHIFSLSENSANKLLKASMRELVKHTHNHVVRIYPKGTRVNSTNYEPHRFWAAGAQVVAINWQTFDLGYMINQAMFQRNGRAGYILKPLALRDGNTDLLSKYTQHFLDVTVISAQQLPRLKDANGQEIVNSSVVDPFVQVSLHIPDWTHSPFLPQSSATANAPEYSAPTDATTTIATSARTISLSTRVIRNNGFNPVWQEQLCLPFDCVGDMTELIFVEFSVRQRGKDDDDDEPIAVYCTPLACLEKGFRHLPLHDSQLTQYLFSTLFVQINIRDIKS